MCVGLPAEDKTYKGCKRELQSRTKKSAVGCTAAYHTLLLHFVITMSQYFMFAICWKIEKKYPKSQGSSTLRI